MIKLISIDLDGTLVDTLPIHRDSFIRAIKTTQNIDISKEYHDKYLIHLSTVDKITRLIEFAELNKNVDYKEIIEEKNKHAFNLIEDIRPNLELNKILWELSERYVFTCVTNANKDFAMHVLRHVHLHDLFDYIITGNDVNKKKPNKEPYEKLLSNYLLMKTDDILVIEDSEDGCKSAKSTGIKKIWKIDSPKDLLDIKKYL